MKDWTNVSKNGLFIGFLLTIIGLSFYYFGFLDYHQEIRTTGLLCVIISYCIHFCIKKQKIWIDYLGVIACTILFISLIGNYIYPNLAQLVSGFSTVSFLFVLGIYVTNKENPEAEKKQKPTFFDTYKFGKDEVISQKELLEPKTHSSNLKKTLTNAQYIGAGIALIGLIFKIMHWTGASVFLIIGLLSVALSVGLNGFIKK
jgi:hypothetical protein